MVIEYFWRPNIKIRSILKIISVKFNRKFCHIIKNSVQIIQRHSNSVNTNFVFNQIRLFLRPFCSLLPFSFIKKLYCYSTVFINSFLLRTEWYKFLYSPSWRSSWNWRIFIFDNYNGVQFITNISFVSSLDHQSVNLW